MSKVAEAVFNQRNTAGLCITCGLNPQQPGDWDCPTCGAVHDSQGESFAEVVQCSRCRDTGLVTETRICDCETGQQLLIALASRDSVVDDASGFDDDSQILEEDEPDDMGICAQCGHRDPLGEGSLCQTCFWEASGEDQHLDDYGDYGVYDEY